MKRKFLILTLCFTIIFSSINYKKSYAFDFVVSPTLFATVVGLGVATGLTLNNDIEMYDFVNNFIYNSKKSIDEMNELLTSCVVLGVGGALTVGKEFIDFFNDTMSSSQGHLGSSDVVVNSNLIGTYNGINIHDFDKFISDPGSYSGLLIKSSLLNSKTNFTVGNASFKYNKSFNGLHSYDVTIGSYTSNLTYNPSTYGDCRLIIGKYTNGNSFYYTAFILASISNPSHYSSSNILTNSLPSSYVGGFDYDYSNDKIKDNQNDDGSVGIYVPGNLGDFVGTLPGSNVGTNENDWVSVGSDGVSLPSVSNPSVDVVGDNTFPSVDIDVPDNPSIDSPSIDGILPPFPSFGDSLDFSPMYLTNVTEKFPFSLPWDMGRLIQKFDVEPKAPIFEVPIVSENITLDLTEFDELASIVRFFVLIGFILSLIFISTRLMG